MSNAVLCNVHCLVASHLTTLQEIHDLFPLVPCVPMLYFTRAFFCFLHNTPAVSHRTYIS